MSNFSLRLLTKFTQQEVRNLFKNSRTKVREHGIDVRLTKQSLAAYGRVLIVIPRTFGNAVKRNLMRRRVKSVFYQEKLFLKGFDSIVLINNRAAALSFIQVQDILLTAFQHALSDTNSSH